MRPNDRARRINAVVWGAFLILVGGLFLYQRVAAEDVPNQLVRLWPLVLLVIGVGHFVEGKPGSGITFVVLGAWLLACSQDWLGLSYGNSWPLTLVAVGAGSVVGALSGEDERGKKSKKNGGAS